MRTTSAWLNRLSGFVPLSPEERRVLESASAATRQWLTHDALAKAGDPADRIFVVLEGLACRFKLLPDGRRQILAYLFPGDMCDPRQLLLPVFDHSLCALVPTLVSTLTAPALHKLESHPGIALAMARYAATQHSIAREWLVNVGHRTAFERIAHLFCEIYLRLESIGLTREYQFDLPLTQAELGDTLALSSVHVNRTLMELRRLKLVTFQNKQIHIHDYAALRAASGFDPAYLQIPADQNRLTMSARA